MQAPYSFHCALVGTSMCLSIRSPDALIGMTPDALFLGRETVGAGGMRVQLAEAPLWELPVTEDIGLACFSDCSLCQYISSVLYMLWGTRIAVKLLTSKTLRVSVICFEAASFPSKDSKICGNVTLHRPRLVRLVSSLLLWIRVIFLANETCFLSVRMYCTLPLAQNKIWLQAESLMCISNNPAL